MRSNTTIAPSRDTSTPPISASARRGLLVPAMLVLAALVVLVSLGNWQLRRLVWKTDLIEQVSERPTLPILDLPPASAWPDFDVSSGEYRRYRLVGHFEHDQEALVFTSLPDPQGPYGGPGYWIVTPFVLFGGGTVLVNRGFAPQGRHLAADRGESLSSEETSVVGLMRPDEVPGLFSPQDRAAEDDIFYARAIERIASVKGISGQIAPFTIDLVRLETPANGLPEAGETRMTFSNSHLQYAITWYGLAAALLAVFAGLVWRRLRETAEDGA